MNLRIRRGQAPDPNILSSRRHDDSGRIRLSTAIGLAVCVSAAASGISFLIDHNSSIAINNDKQRAVNVIYNDIQKEAKEAHRPVTDAVGDFVLGIGASESTVKRDAFSLSQTAVDTIVTFHGAPNRIPTIDVGVQDLSTDLRVITGAAKKEFNAVFQDISYQQTSYGCCWLFGIAAVGMFPFYKGTRK